jgi:hypothetical protein
MCNTGTLLIDNEVMRLNLFLEVKFFLLTFFLEVCFHLGDFVLEVAQLVVELFVLDCLGGGNCVGFCGGIVIGGLMSG